MRGKYFTANTLDDATKMAYEYFGGENTELKIDVISGRDAVPSDEAGSEAIEAEPWTIVAIQGALAAISNMNSFFGLYYEPDGVYLEVYESRGIGGDLDSNDLIEHLRRKRTEGIAISVIQDLVQRKAGRAKIASPQREYVYGEDMSVTVTGDEREASVRLLEPEPNGTLLDLSAAKKILAENGVIHGIDEEGINSMLSAKVYNEPYVIARATPPTDGEDGKLLLHFSTEERTGRPREIDSTGRVDFRSLDLYVPVTENQLLASRTAATQGEPGTSVKGNVIKQRLGKEAVLPRGKSITYNDDRTEVYAACAGMVEYVGGALNVSNVYSINGDCDISTGNVDFDGCVQISGSVRSGNTVKATGGISVGGSVEGATLISGGNVEIKGGMMGADKGVIDAAGSVSVMFIERGKISSDGPIKVDVAIHSTLETSSTILASGKRGAIIGGNANAAGDIIANFIGALSNTKTFIRVGFLPRKRAQLEELERDMERIKTEKTKHIQLFAYLEKNKATMNKETWEKLYVSGMENKRINAETEQSHIAEIERLNYEMEHATENKVHVLETAFGGSRITIGNTSLVINDDISFATFRYGEGEITYGPCEKSKSDYK